MLSDRNYMGNPIRNSQRRQASTTTFLFALIAVNVVVYFISPDNMRFTNAFGLNAAGIKQMQVWRLITSMFMHADFYHLLFNMFGLYFFGTFIASELDVSRFVNLYFISGVFGGVLWVLCNWSSQAYLLPDGTVIHTTVIGASGAVSGVVMAAAMLFPDKMVMLLFPPVPMKLKTMAIVFIALDIFFQMNNATNIAHLAHLGGFVGAYFYIKFLYGSRAWDPLGFLFSGNKNRNASPPGWKIKDYTSKPDTSVSQQELDRVLDKISASGINSLSSEEQALLKRAREEMKNR